MPINLKEANVICNNLRDEISRAKKEYPDSREQLNKIDNKILSWQCNVNSTKEIGGTNGNSTENDLTEHKDDLVDLLGQKAAITKETTLE